MCGIAGYLRLSEAPSTGARPAELPDLERMTRVLTHRGPDSEGFFRDPGVGLGMRRLRVIDLETGDQPMADESGEVTVVYNGEIYNFRELRAGLEERGHRFRTRCDTEVLVHGYREWGDELPERLRGMFAFALWDRRRRRLLLARDHFGIKPLYYARLGDLLLFGSEIKSLLAVPELPRELDPEALDQYLSFLYVPEPRTLFRAVRALPPGHLASCGNGGVEIRRYWRYRPRPGGFRSRTEAIDAVREGFEDSVRAMLVADVPVGLFLSSGIDSASILAMMARHADGPVRTFSIGFGGAEHRWDELATARELAARFGAEHREFRVDPDVVSTLPEVVRCFDQPFANPTAVILQLLAGEARRHTTVALSGTGGDELFAGYPRYLGMLLHRRYRWLPGPLRRLAAGLARRLLRDRSDGRPAIQRARRFLESGALPFADGYVRMLVAVDDERRRALYTPELAERLSSFDGAAFVRDELADGGLDRLLAADVATYLPFNQLAYGDRMTMSRSLELRVPFVDQRLAEVAAAIPLDWHLRRGITKGLLREAMAPFLPPEIVRRPKLGLNLPIPLWFRGELNGWMRSLLAPERLAERGLLRPEAVAGLIGEHESGRRDHSLILWALVVLELWHREVLER